MNVTDELRIRYFDSKNVIIEEWNVGVNPRTKEEVGNWRTVGYYPNTRLAIEAIIRNDMLVDFDKVETLKDYQEALEEQVQTVTEKLEEVYQ